MRYSRILKGGSLTRLGWDIKKKNNGCGWSVSVGVGVPDIEEF
jgi:hypothetical protein